MLRYAIRRTLWAIPTLFGISLVVFFVTALIPDPAADLPARAAALVQVDPTAYDALEEQRRQRFLDLPALFNGRPADVRSRATEAMTHVANDDAKAALGAHVLAKLGGAALPFVLPELDKLPPAARARVAVALAPVGERMHAAPQEKLEDASEAVLFWSRFWEDRALDFTAPALHRAVHRLVLHATDLRERDLVSVDTYALSEVVPAMTSSDDREAIRVLARLASHVTGRDGRVPFDADDDDLRRIVSGWQAWWQVHESDYVAYDGASRVAATILETRYGKWVLGAATGRLGTSSLDGLPIAEKVRARAPLTLLLTLLSLAVSYVVAVPLGALVAWMRGRPIDVTLALILFAAYSLPTFWAAQILAHTYATVPHDVLGVAKGTPIPLREAWGRLAAPVVALALGSIATLSRYQRAATLETIRQDYVRTAKAKGASPFRQVVVHALRNAMLPTVTLAGLQFPALLGGAFVVEEVFAVPGMGYETMRAVEGHDVPWLVAIALLTAVVTTFALIASDLAYGALDPRIRDASGAPRGGFAA
jgi:ABC-type dipeptide/oligopeptide/nickel transport system permease component